MLYSLEPCRETLHGILCKTIPPALVVRPGDTVAFRTLAAGWRVGPPTAPRRDSGTFFPQRTLPYDAGHPLCGPVAVEGAKPGMTLTVRLDEIEPGSWGWSSVGGPYNTEHRDLLGWAADELYTLWKIDPLLRVCVNDFGYRVPVRPFMGIMATCPDNDTPTDTKYPGVHGGNLDCKEITRGSTLYLPVFVEGALFSTGDGHAAQGDGESASTAVECPMERLVLTFGLLNEAIPSPICETPQGWITFGFDQDLTKATYSALLNMVALMERKFSMPHHEALSLSSMVVDLRVTQIVNGIRGAHAFLPHGSIVR